MAGILKLSDRKFKITMNEMLRVLAEKVVNTLVQMDNGSRKVAALWKNHKEMLENKNPVTEMKNASDGHISRLDMTKTKISVFEKHVNRNFQNRNIKRKKWMEKQNRISKIWGTITKGIDYFVILHVCNGKIPWRRKWQPTPVFLPGKSYRQRSLMGYSPWDHKRVRHDLATKQ